MGVACTRMLRGARCPLGLLRCILRRLVLRRFLRISFKLTLIALALVVAMLLLGDKVFHRTAPAVRLVYDVQEIGGGRLGDAQAEEMAKALQQRLDRQQMREVQVQPAGPKIQVLAPASVPKGDLKRVLAMGGMLSFHVVVEDPNEAGVSEMLARMEPGGGGPKPHTGDALRWFPCAQTGISPVEATSGGINYILVYTSDDRSMTHADISRPWSVKNARPTRDQAGGTAVAFELDKPGAKRFGELTGNNLGRKLAIVLDGNVLSVPRVNNRIEGHGIISGGPGGFAPTEAEYLTSTLNAGSLPAKLADEPVSEEYLTMTLGLSPLARSLLKVAAIALAIIAALLWVARLLLRRLHPTVRDQQAALRSLGLYDQP
ncbi:MAG: SecD/SecF fusion protein [Humisphaera sp.]|nr:SecD/SecF fusion protein [Humisphaera sp.]